MARLNMSSDWREQVLDASVPTMREIGKEIETRYAAGVGVDTGHLKESIYSDTDPINGDTQVGAMASYARAHEFGIKEPYLILPKTAGGTLAFKVGGRTVFAKSVVHPPMEENPALARAINTVRAKGKFHA